MPAPKRLLLFVEGPGDRDAAPILIKRLLTDLNGWDALTLDKTAPWMVGGVPDVTKDSGKDWVRWLSAARGQTNLGAVLLLLDGDLKSLRNEPFCVATFAARLADWAQAAGGGAVFSVACVFARQEYESWFVAGADRLAGVPLPDRREGIRAGTTAPDPGQNIEADHIRDAKKWLSQRMQFGYKERRDQPLLTKLLVPHLDVLRDRPMTSFLRLERAVRELVEANRAGQHIVSPVWPRPATVPPDPATPETPQPSDNSPPENAGTQ